MQTLVPKHSLLILIDQILRLLEHRLPKKLLANQFDLLYLSGQLSFDSIL